MRRLIKKGSPMRHFMNSLSFIFNWRKNPSSVFILVIPLFLLGMTLMAVLAVLQMKLNQDPVYLYIFLGGIVLLALGLIPAFRMK